MTEFTTERERLDAATRATLMEMWYSMGSKERLQAIGALTSDPAILDFLRDLAEAENAQRRATDMILAESQAHARIFPHKINEQAIVSVALCERGRVDGAKYDVDVAELPYDRLLVLRALGQGVFKVLGEGFGSDIDALNDECFRDDDSVRIGAARVSKDGVTIERAVRFAETLGVKNGEQTTTLGAYCEVDSAELRLLVSNVMIDDVMVLPYTGPK